VSPEFVTLTLVVITALVFDFTNGFHDTGNAMATSIATKALPPRTAVAMSAVLNLVGAFLSAAWCGTSSRGSSACPRVPPTRCSVGSSAQRSLVSVSRA